MSVNNRPGALQGIKAIADRTLDSSEGIRIECPDHAAALKLRQQFNSLRVADRRDSTKIYPADHVMYGNSVYDGIETRLFDNVLIFKSTSATLGDFKITDLETNKEIKPEEL